MKFLRLKKVIMDVTTGLRGNKSTYHDIYETAHGDFYIVSSLSFRKDTQITKIDGRSGLMHYEGLPGLDLFSNHRQATAFLQKKYILKSKLRANALLGYIVAERYSYLLVATKTRNEGDILGVHPIYVVMETQWIKIELSYLSSCKLPISPHTPQTNGNLCAISTVVDNTSNTNHNSHGSSSSSNSGSFSSFNLQLYPLEGTHFYCETYDLTNYFPSSPKAPDQFSPEFTWNEWLRRPFRTFSLPFLCVVLLQGYASIKQLNNSSKSLLPLNSPITTNLIHKTKNLASICYLMKKSKLNPETYFYGHGINDKGGAANEYECEIILWRLTGINTISWTSYLWRRGTIPLWWRARSKHQGNDLLVKDNPFEYSDKYFTGILDRYSSIYETNTAALPTINLVSLLKMDDPQEGPLGQLYQKLCNRVASTVNLNLNLQSFDWHIHLKNNNQSLTKTVHSLWSTLKEPIENAGFSKGTAKILYEEATDCSSPTDSNSNQQQPLLEKRLVFEQYSHQKEITKFSCLESLERVNIVTYFSSFQTVGLMAKSLGLSFTDAYPFSSNITLEVMNSSLKRLGLFIPLTEFFVTSSDVCNILYLNNLSQPTPIMREYINSISASSVNHLISLQRKYQNTNTEENRNKQYLIFLGIFGSKYFHLNSATQNFEIPSGLISCAPVTTLFALPSLMDKSKLNPSILIREIDDFCWIFPSEVKKPEVIVYLGCPSIITEICLTVSHGTNSDTYPQTMDVFLGAYLDSMFIVLQDILIPRCTTGTKLSYEVPNCPWNQYGTTLSTEDPVGVASNRYMNRFVKIEFRGSSLPITIGKIEVFGYQTSKIHQINLSMEKDNHIRSTLFKVDVESNFVLDTNNISSIDQDKLELTDYTPLDLNSEAKTEKLQDSVIEQEISNILSVFQNHIPTSYERNDIKDTQNHLPASNHDNDIKSNDSSPNEILLIRDYSGGKTFMEDDPYNDGLTETMKISTNKKAIPSQQYEQAILDTINGSIKQPQKKRLNPTLGNTPRVKDDRSPPIETILLPPDVLPLSVYWSAPPSVSSVDISIALSYDALVYSITLLVDSLGYYNYNVPSVEIKIGKTLLTSQLESIGPWTFQPNGWSSNPNQVIQPQSCISFILPQPMQARMISLRFSLPNLPTFLTYDNDEPVKPFLHIGRIAIHGFYNDTLSEVPTFMTSSIPLESSDKELYENTLYSNSLITLKRNPVKTISNQVKSAKTIHINIDPSTTVKGFSAIITHEDLEGVRSQAKGLTISCVTTNQKNEFVDHKYFISNYGGSILATPNGWVKTTNNVDPSTRITLTFALRLQNIDTLEVEWLVQNMEATIVKQLPDFVVAQVSVKSANNHLNTNFQEFENTLTKKRVIRTLGPYSINENYSDLVHFIGGTVRFPNHDLSNTMEPDHRFLSSLNTKDSVSNAPDIVRVYAGDTTFSFLSLPRCYDGNTTTDPTLGCNGNSFISYQISSNTQNFKANILLDQLTCQPCNGFTNTLAQAVCLKSCQTLQLPNNTVYCLTGELSGSLENYLPLNLSLTTLYNDSTTSSPYYTTTYLGQFLTPQVIQERYQMPFLTGSFSNNTSVSPDWSINSQSVAEFLEQYYSDADLVQFFKMVGIDSRLSQRVTVIGPNDQSNPGGEASLDIQYLMGLAAGYNTTFWSVGNLTNGQEPFLDWIIDVINGPEIIYVHSVSYGDDEDSLSIDYMQRINQEFIKAGSLGMTLVFSSGDMGANGNTNTPLDHFVPSFPASSPYVLAVGATQFSTQTSPACTSKPVGIISVKCNSVGEIASSIATGSRITSGGGFSNVFARPSYQENVTSDYISTYLTNIPQSYYNQSGRAYPDISALGHNYLVILSGNIVPVDGTSASAPTIASIISIINDKLLRRGEEPLGFVNPSIYAIGSQNPDAFFDIVMGDNSCPESFPCNQYGYPATPGYDTVTGFGSPIFPVLEKLLAPIVRIPDQDSEKFTNSWKAAIIVPPIALFVLTSIFIAYILKKIKSSNVKYDAI
ncbi:hypothetical protein PPL_07069 [Heterostelium album PN500]|uniref:Uncharacterized protein n=1 Tax=Heterostelium pallidum (strain ATCC 26659 / Pp 5 / PN500) TaxID=670386 RepID=D3BEB3_HETP5|nr:hypothetical protein PPL_07069 [Heterostelium album PN500]EFA80244.1 hypothetical protein PPL_07069 [Heterostelium album PN500]|eukprot:XP_020432364.1 hypothetical protein PPL_07069 [Heterostelium album PN500]